MRRIFALAAIAWVAFAIRTAATVQAMSMVGAPIPLGRMVVIELTNAVAWTLWVMVLLRFVARASAAQPTSGFSAARAGWLAAAATTPVVVIPAIVAPVHAFFFSDNGALGDALRHVLTHNAILNLLIGATITSVAHGQARNERLRELERTAERLNADLNRAQLEMLRAQLDPHFLFNALNSITVLARRGQNDDVARMIEHLSGLLRYSLDSARSQLVPMRVELEALKHYVRIEEVRRGDRLAVRVDVPPALSESMVPSLLLQPLVENAIRHGTAPDQLLTVSIAASRSGEQLSVIVADDGAGTDAEQASDGVGLGNTRARLAGLFGGRASLTLRPNPAGRGTEVAVILPADARTDS